VPDGTAEPRYELHEAAHRDLLEIWEYIAEDNIDAADRVVSDILAACEALAASPHIGHARAQLTSRPLRFWVVRNYVIAYAPEPPPLAIFAIIHGRRNPRFMAGILRGRV
jgi:antitoxin ParD1/3/4/toxin ParE1/3/4